ncbi:hypothetical protein BGZ83_002040 [Gryganskiella cystojenkinii]|nr:hypothetical protein BGZ83_002040 [Gryganskiella cystojenkinii]
MQQQQQQQQQQQRREEIYLEKTSASSQQQQQPQQPLTASAPSTPSFKPQPHSRPRLSLDTSQERLAIGADFEVVKHGDKSYLKLFSPILVESPVSFLNELQQREDKKKWENGPDEAFQRELEMERREAFKDI